MNKQLQTRIGELLKKDYFKLEFGCVIIGKDGKDLGVYLYRHITGKYYSYNKDIDEAFWFNPDEGKILGTEPTLQDVLLAIKDTFDEIGFIENSKLGFYNATYGIEIKYDLTKSLFNQTDEVKQQLLELMS